MSEPIPRLLLAPKEGARRPIAVEIPRMKRPNKPVKNTVRAIKKIIIDIVNLE